MARDLEIRELESAAAIGAAFEVMAELRPHLQAAEFVDRVRAQSREGYRLIGGFAGGQLVALAGFRFAQTLARGPHLFVDDLVTAKEAQRRGFGGAMLRYLARLAEEQGLSRVWLDSRDTAVTFYEQVGFHVHTSKPCWIEVEELREKEARQ